MAATIRGKTNTSMMVARSIFSPRQPVTASCGLIDYCAFRSASTKSGGGGKKSAARLPEVQRLLYQAVERYKDVGGGIEPIPKITLVLALISFTKYYLSGLCLLPSVEFLSFRCGNRHAASHHTGSSTTRVQITFGWAPKQIYHVTIPYANSSGPSAQYVQKVSTRVDMRFNVKNAHWLSERVRERIMQMEKNRINKDGEIVITSSKTRAQKSNTEDAMAKLQVFTYQKKKLQVMLSLMLLRMCHHLLQKRRSKRLQSCRLLGSRNEWTRRKRLEEAEMVGTNMCRSGKQNFLIMPKI
ncbi:hypothetical protein BUALT_Bualt04G0055500 [Buddleja alternifolia]|uniref:Uncharacterized protein n=1 Tax=Buddleja alternifolia TaxID=168488 RepID=A0AAV6XU33_9LAMI|nr:hypothetical protein BUALT_Bualt04G0055500 [Buddleja alternifolia]